MSGNYRHIKQYEREILELRTKANKRIFSQI